MSCGTVGQANAAATAEVDAATTRRDRHTSKERKARVELQAAWRSLAELDPPAI